jgi:hypothetical protein
MRPCRATEAFSFKIELELLRSHLRSEDAYTKNGASLTDAPFDKFPLTDQR